MLCVLFLFTSITFNSDKKPDLKGGVGKGTGAMGGYDDFGMGGGGAADYDDYDDFM